MADLQRDLIGSRADTTMFNASVRQGKAKTQVKKNFDVDSGWAWVVLASVFCLLALMQGFQRSKGLVFLAIEDKYRVSSSVTSLIGGVGAITFGISVIFVMTFVLEVVSVQKAVVVGVTLMTSAVAISSAVTSYPMLVFTLGAMVGVGESFMYGPSFVLLGKYFDKRLALATAVANTGVSFGAFVMPFVVRELLNEFSLSGGLLVMGGVLGNQFVCACLLRPFPAFPEGAESKPRLCTADAGRSERKTADKASEPLLGVTGQIEIDGDEESTLPESGYKNTGQFSASNMADETRLGDTVHGADTIESHLFCGKILLSEADSKTGDMTRRQESLASHSEDMVPKVETSFTHVESRPEHVETNSKNAKTRAENLQTGTTPDLSLSPVILGDGLSRSPKCTFRVLINRPRHIACKSVCSIRDENVDVIGDRDAVKGSPAGCLSSARRKLSQRFDVTVLTSFAFWVLVCSQWFGILLGNLGPVFLPSLALEMGFSEREATFMLMLNGGFDILSRILPGVIANYKLLQPHQMVIATQVILGILCQFTVLFNTYPAMVAFSAALGGLGGVIFSMTQIMIIDILALERFSVAFGFIQLFNATSSAVGFPVVGYLKDTTGRFTASFHFLGATQFVSSAILASFLLLRRCQQRRERAEV